jgi:hypothetical protein
VELARSLLTAERGARVLIGTRMRDLDVQAEALETPGRAAEARVWHELSASQGARRGRKAGPASRELEPSALCLSVVLPTSKPYPDEFPHAIELDGAGVLGWRSR